MNKDIFIWIAIILATILAGTKDDTFKVVVRWAILIIVLGDMYLYFQR